MKYATREDDLARFDGWTVESIRKRVEEATTPEQLRECSYALTLLGLDAQAPHLCAGITKRIDHMTGGHNEAARSARTAEMSAAYSADQSARTQNRREQRRNQLFT